MQEYIKRYHKARTAKKYAKPIAILGLILEVVLPFVGAYYMEYFTIYMIFALLGGITMIVYPLATTMICGNRTNDLARAISELDITEEEKLKLAGEYGIDLQYMSSFMCKYFLYSKG